MNWLASNWIWILLGIGVLYVMARRGRGAGHHAGNGSLLRSEGFGNDVGSTAESAPPSTSGVAVDPVTRKDVSTTGALTSIYNGRIYYFETPQNRQLFEASPQQYAREEFGRPLAPAPDGYRQRRRRRGGC